MSHLEARTRGVESADPSYFEALEVLERHLRAPRLAFHAFSYRGDELLYDLNTGSLLGLAPTTRLVFAAYERRDDPQAIAQLIRSTFSEVQAADFARQVESLARLGLFTLEKLPTPEKRAKDVASHEKAAPRSEQILVQTSCNLKCTYCYEVKAGFHGTGKSMSTETGRKAVELLLTRSGRRRQLDLNFFGGEPLLNFALIVDLVEYAQLRGKALGKQFTFKITTNATLLTDEIIKFLVDHPFAVMLSLDGPPELADSHRVDHAGKGVARKALENAKKLVAAQRKAGRREALIRATMTPGNHSTLTLARFFEQEGFRRVMIGASDGQAFEKGPHDIGQPESADMKREAEEIIDLFLAGAKSKRRALPRGVRIEEGLKRIHKALSEPGDPGRSVHCGVGRNMTAVTEHGDIYPCHRYVGQPAYVIGNIATGVDAELVTDYYRKVFDVYDRHCSSCWARHVCGGQCPWYLSKADGELVDPDSGGCDGIRRGAERLLWLYAKIQKDQSAATSAKENS